MSEKYTQAMEFVVKFLKHYEEKGIMDKFDKSKNQMVTSPAIYELVREARRIVPERVSGKEAVRRVRELTKNELDAAIHFSGEKVLDARTIFSRKMAENGGVRGITMKMIEADERGDYDAVDEYMAMLAEFKVLEEE